MSLVELIMAAEAAAAQRAVRRTAYRHVHVVEKPLVVVAYNLSGEAAAPLGIMYGTDPDPAKASLVVSAEPRNRDSRFAAINKFAADLVEWVKPYLVVKTVPTKAGGYRQVVDDAPQIVVPNRATRSYLGARIGRSLRYVDRWVEGVPEVTQWTGAHLSWLAEHSRLPGQSTFLSMTEALSQHFVTGQSALEDENLATLLAWIDGVDGDLLPALEALEETAYGPVPNPTWEARLEPFVKAYTEGLRAGDAEKMGLAENNVEREVRAALQPAYSATHRAIEVLRGIEPSPGVSGRWQTDLNDWSWHAVQCAQRIPRFKARHDPLRAAKTLQRWSKAQEDLETAQAFDDPLILARLDADGRCVTGEVTSIDWAHREIKPGNQKPSKAPLIELSLTAPTRLLQDEAVRWPDDRRVKGTLRWIDDTTVTVVVISGMKALGDVGLAPGDDTVFVDLDPWEGPNPDAPDEVPWTHRATTSELAGDGTDDPTAGADDDSPDLAIDELAALPLVGVVGPDEEPGVLL